MRMLFFICLSIFIIIFTLASCSTKSTEYKVTIVENTFNSSKVKGVYVKNNKKIRFRSLYSNSDNDLFFSFFINDSIYARYDFSKDSLRLEELPLSLKLSEKGGLSYINDEYLYINENDNIIKIGANQKVDTIFKDVLSENEFYKHSFYDDNIKVYNDSIYFQYGKTGTISLIDSMSTMLMCNGRCERILPYPSYFFTNYIHYNGLVSTKYKDKIYYTFQTSKYIQSFSMDNGFVKTISLPYAEKYLLFNTNKNTDILYIKKYSEQTAFNYRLFCLNNRVVLLTRNTSGKKKNFKFLVYDSDLNFLGESILNEHIPPYNITSDNEKIIILDIYEGKIYNLFFN